MAVVRGERVDLRAVGIQRKGIVLDRKSVV